MRALIESLARGQLIRKNSYTARVGHEIYYPKGNRKATFYLTLDEHSTVEKENIENFKSDPLRR